MNVQVSGLSPTRCGGVISIAYVISPPNAPPTDSPWIRRISTSSAVEIIPTTTIVMSKRPYEILKSSYMYHIALMSSVGGAILSVY